MYVYMYYDRADLLSILDMAFFVIIYQKIMW